MHISILLVLLLAFPGTRIAGPRGVQDSSSMPFAASAPGHLRYDTHRLHYNGLLQYNVRPQERIVAEKVITTVEYDPVLNPKSQSVATAVSGRKEKSRSSDKKQTGAEVRSDAGSDSDSPELETRRAADQNAECDGYSNCSVEPNLQPATRDPKSQEAWMRGMMILHTTRINTIVKRLASQQETLDKMSKKISEIGNKISVLLAGDTEKGGGKERSEKEYSVHEGTSDKGETNDREDRDEAPVARKRKNRQHSSASRSRDREAGLDESAKDNSDQDHEEYRSKDESSGGGAASCGRCNQPAIGGTKKLKKYIKRRITARLPETTVDEESLKRK